MRPPNFSLDQSVNAIYKVNAVYYIGRMTPRARRREANIQRILDTAMQIVIDEGFNALSVHRLARELDYTPGALYRYFRSKDLLIATLTRQVLEHFGAIVQGVVDEQPCDAPIARIRAALFAYRDLAQSAPERFGLLSLLLADPRLLVPDPETAGPVIDAMMLALQPLVDSFERAQNAGVLDKGRANERALVAFCSVHGILQLRKQQRRKPGLFDLEAMVQNSIHTLLLGWGAPIERVQAAASPTPRSVT